MKQVKEFTINRVVINGQMDTENYTYVYYNVDTKGFNDSLIKSKMYKWNESVTYTILNNDSSKITFEDDTSTTKLYRSVILDENQNIIGFAPPNSISYERFVEKQPEITDSIYANEIVEGTMLNLFYDRRIQSWQLSTRGAVGANYWFYRNQYGEKETTQKTFREMFVEGFHVPMDTDLNCIPFIQSLPKNYSYSFVLQHPENHIVMNITVPTLYLVAIYEISNTRVTSIPLVVYETWDVFENDTAKLVQFPKKFDEKSYQDYMAKYCNADSDYKCMGVMFTNLITGDRMAMSNKAYEEVKKFRGNNPNMQFQFYTLEKSLKTDFFLYYFPMYKPLFEKFSREYQDFITNVHQSYFSYYVKKEGIPIAKRFFIHASKIHHNVFIPSMVDGNKIIITRTVVKAYFDALTPSEIVYYLNYDEKQIGKANKAVNSSETASSETVSSEPEIISV
jgi:hypothetical protein